MNSRVHFILRIEGMTCDGCARHVAQALKGVLGVESAEVGDWREGKAAVVAEESTPDETLADAVSGAGYRALIEAKRPLEEGKEVPLIKGTDFDLMAIGGGSAAFAAAIKAAELGARVAIVEAATIGGTCVNIGCVPSKTLIKAAEICYHSAYSNFKGMAACPPPSEWQAVIRQKDELVGALREEKYTKVLKAYPGITLIRGRAKLTGGRGVLVDGKPYNPGKILIATGSLPWAPSIPGLAEAGYMDSTDALSLPELPKSLIVVGGGAIGLELGQLFARFGVLVTLLVADPHIAPVEDPEIGNALKTYLEGERITVVTGAKIERIDRSNSQYKVQVEVNERRVTFQAEKLLVATGRRANTGGFGLEGAGVKLGKMGEIMVDSRLRTDNPDIYAAGDCIGNPMYVYVAAYGGQLAA
ncbi:MAG: FAD-dependent oxidoreductase, partial [Nitrospirae bacterium]|nr:FAD-dependent oxidoreductase [Nitrospirota bacterium]